jgi:hypothetical protein
MHGFIGIYACIYKYVCMSVYEYVCMGLYVLCMFMHECMSMYA